MKKLLVCAVLCCLILTACNPSPARNNAIPENDSTSINQGWKLGAQMWTFHSDPFTVALSKVDSAGIKYIEAFLGQPMGGDFNDTFDLNMSAESKKRLLQLLESKGIGLMAIGVVVPQTPEEWRRTFEFAKDLGIQYITAEPIRSHWDTVNTMAGEYKIMVAIHDHPRPSPYDHPDSVMNAIKGRINMGACADLGHWARNGLDVVKCLQTLEGRVIGVHLKDIKTFNDVKSEDVILGTGVIDYPAVFSELKKQGFNGMYSIEHEANIGNNLSDVIQNRKYFETQTSGH